METTQLTELVADIVSAHVSNNSVAVNDMPNLIQQVHAALTRLGRGTLDAAQGKSPVVSVRASVKPDYIVCMECGKKQKRLRRHLQTAHGLAPDQYRKDYGLPDTYPLTAPNYCARRRTTAKTLGLGRKPKSDTDAAIPSTPARRRKRS